MRDGLILRMRFAFVFWRAFEAHGVPSVFKLRWGIVRLTRVEEGGGR